MGPLLWELGFGGEAYFGMCMFPAVAPHFVFGQFILLRLTVVDAMCYMLDRWWTLNYRFSKPAVYDILVARIQCLCDAHL